MFKFVAKLFQYHFPMKTAKLRFFVISLFLMLFVTAAQCEENEVIVLSVTYDYELFYTPNGRLDCQGTLILDVQHPANTKRIIVEKTKPRLWDADRQLFTLRSLYDTDLTSTRTLITMRNPAIWGCRFKVRAQIDSETNYYSDVYDINDYISPEDLALLLDSQTDSIDSPQNSKPELTFADGILRVKNVEIATLSIFDLQGRCLLTREINGDASIRLNDFDANLFVVKLQMPDNIIVSKLLRK